MPWRLHWSPEEALEGLVRGVRYEIYYPKSIALTIIYLVSLIAVSVVIYGIASEGTSTYIDYMELN